jgi:nucleoside-diphosphate-sugar epimerase
VELAAAFLAGAGRRVMGIGTCAEYAAHDLDDDEPWPETRQLDPPTRYGRAKAALFEMLQRLCASKPPSTLAWARLFHLFGAGEKPERLVASLLRDLLAGREAPCSRGEAVRDFASTWFAARALASLLRSDVGGPVNIGSGVGRSVAEMARTVATAAGRRELLRIGALPDRAGEIASMVAHVGRLREEVGFTETADVAGDLRRVIASRRPRRKRS